MPIFPLPAHHSVNYHILRYFSGKVLLQRTKKGFPKIFFLIRIIRFAELIKCVRKCQTKKKLSFKSITKLTERVIPNISCSWASSVDDANFSLKKSFNRKVYSQISQWEILKTSICVRLANELRGEMFNFRPNQKKKKNVQYQEINPKLNYRKFFSYCA